MKKNCYKLIPLTFLSLTLGACASKNSSVETVAPEVAFEAVEKAAKKTSEADKARIKTVDSPIYGQFGVEVKNNNKWNYLEAKVEHLPLDLIYSNYATKDAKQLQASIISKGDGKDAPGATLKINTDMEFNGMPVDSFTPRIEDLSVATYIKDGTVYVDYSDPSLKLVTNLMKLVVKQYSPYDVTFPKSNKAKVTLDEEGLNKVNDVMSNFDVDVTALRKLHNDVPSLFEFKGNKITVRATTKEEFKSYLEAAYDIGSSELDSSAKDSASSAKTEVMEKYDKYMEYATFNSFVTTIGYDDKGISSMSSSLNISSFDHDGLVAAYPDDEAFPYGKFSYSGEFEFSYEGIAPMFTTDLDNYEDIVVKEKTPATNN